MPTEKNTAQTVPTIPSTVPPKKHKALKIVLFTLLGFFIFVGLVLFVTLVPVGNQSLLSKTFDSIGNHNIALGLDNIRYSGLEKTLSVVNAIDPKKPESCGKLWDTMKDVPFEYGPTSSQTEVEFMLNNSKYKDILSFYIFASIALDPGNFEQNYNLKLSVKNDMDKIADLLKPYYQDNDQIIKELNKYGVFTTDAEISMIQSYGDFFFQLSKLETKSSKDDSLNLNANLKDWYQMTNTISEKQKSELKEMYQNLKNIVEIKPSEAMSDETGQAFFALVCNYIDKFEIEGPQTITFGRDKNKTTKEVRPISITFKSDLYSVFKNSYEDMFNLLDTISTDKKLIDYIKSIYSKAKFISEINISQSEYNNYVDDYFNYLQKEFSGDKREKNLKDFKSSVEVIANTASKFTRLSVPSIRYYINIDDGTLYGLDTELKLQAQKELVDSISSNNADLNNILTDGFTLKISSYDTKRGDEVVMAKIPSNTKDYSQLGNDFLNTDLGKKLQESYKSLQPTSSSTTPINEYPYVPGNVNPFGYQIPNFIN